MDRYQRGYDQAYDRMYGGGQRFRGNPYQPPFRAGGPGYGRDYYGRPPRRPFRGDAREPRGGEYFGYTDRYDNDFRYARPRKSQWQTERGDPFGDRQHHTPMRTIRGEPDWDGRGQLMRGYDRNYRDYEAWGFPQQYQPYSPEAGYHID